MLHRPGRAMDRSLPAPCHRAPSNPYAQYSMLVMYPLRIYPCRIYPYGYITRADIE